MTSCHLPPSLPPSLFLSPSLPPLPPSFPPSLFLPLSPSLPLSLQESNYFTPQGEFRVDAAGSSTLLNCLMYKLAYYRFGEVQVKYIIYRSGLLII